MLVVVVHSGRRPTVDRIHTAGCCTVAGQWLIEYILLACALKNATNVDPLLVAHDVIATQTRIQRGLHRVPGTDPNLLPRSSRRRRRRPATSAASCWGSAGTTGTTPPCTSERCVGAMAASALETGCDSRVHHRLLGHGPELKVDLKLGRHFLVFCVRTKRIDGELCDDLRLAINERSVDPERHQLLPPATASFDHHLEIAGHADTHCEARAAGNRLKQGLLLAENGGHGRSVSESKLQGKRVSTNVRSQS